MKPLDRQRVGPDVPGIPRPYCPAPYCGQPLPYGAVWCSIWCKDAAEKDTRDSASRKGESTHSRPCEFPEVLPCCCPVRPRVLPDASTVRATSRARIAAFFIGVRWGRMNLPAVPGD
ncbi:hypothetical protein [Streptomyces sp. NPDC051561]|uniref:hypothetical protein n=1 Tax=Streptomyces sp. NPDC051561 TaxID=3365658 RepID=UPI0037A32255